MIVLADVTDSRNWSVEGGATSSHHSGSKWGHFRLAHSQLDPELLAGLHRRYDDAVSWGITTNRHRDWARGNHPGYNLATRLRDKAEQVWTFTRNLAVPWTNNASEQALKSPKRNQVVSGYWHTLITLGGYCRVRSYLVSARGHNIRPIDAIHNALTGDPWLPTPATA